MHRNISGWWSPKRTVFTYPEWRINSGERAASAVPHSRRPASGRRTLQWELCNLKVLAYLALEFYGLCQSSFPPAATTSPPPFRLGIAFLAAVKVQYYNSKHTTVLMITLGLSRQRNPLVEAQRRPKPLIFPSSYVTTRYLPHIGSVAYDVSLFYFGVRAMASPVCSGWEGESPRLLASLPLRSCWDLCAI